MAKRATAPVLSPEPAAPAATPPRLIPVPKWNDYHAWPPAGGMRHLIFHAQNNGFDRAFLRVGRSVLVNEGEFFAACERANAAKRKVA